MNDFNSTNNSKIHWLSHAAIFAAVIALTIIATGGWFGITMVEKLLTRLAMPVGLLWLVMISVTYAAMVSRQRLVGILALIGLVLLTTFGNRYAANALVQSLEQPYIDQAAPEPGDVDTVVLLGGGATTNLRGRSQLAINGDRIAAAARLYHKASAAGITLRILCTGQQVYRVDDADLDPKEESKNSLIALKVSQQHLSTLDGINTYQEMQHLKEWLQQQSQGHRVGILTSAWHLPRAMRLAEARGIEATAIPSDFRSSFLVPSINMLVPTADALEISSISIKEYLAGLVKR
jgi:uncharacterized SAM-binding protein YcdF (DUF218 family)